MKIVLGLVIGLCWGSFLTAVKNRLENLETVLTGWSQCPKCKKRLKAVDLIPILSFVLLRSRCRYCRKPIAFTYPLIELICALLAIIVVLKFGTHFSSILIFVSLSLLALAGFLDVESREVDLRVFIAGIVLAIIWQAFSITSWPSAAFIILAGLAAMLVPAAFYFISRERWMGLGDVLFAFWIGVIAGYPAALVAMLVAFLLGGIFGIIALVARGKKAERRIAFGPFIAVGGLIGLLWGQEIITYYLKLIGF